MNDINQDEIINDAKNYADKMNRGLQCYTTVSRHTDNLISIINKKDAEIAELKRIIAEKDAEISKLTKTIFEQGEDLTSALQSLEDAQRFMG